MLLEATTLAVVDSYWGDFFACRDADLSDSQTLVVPHAALGEYHGIWLFRRGQTLIVSVPERLDATDRARLSMMTASDFDDSDRFGDSLRAPIDQVIGPALIGYADATTFQPHDDSSVRLLRTADRAAWAALREACSSIEWEHGGSEFGEKELAGYFIGDQLAALAGYELWGSRIAHIAVVTHPAHRGRGYGGGVVSGLAAAVLEAGLVPQYRTLRSNTPSMRIASELGFVPYAETIAIRLA